MSLFKDLAKAYVGKSLEEARQRQTIDAYKSMLIRLNDEQLYEQYKETSTLECKIAAYEILKERGY